MEDEIIFGEKRAENYLEIVRAFTWGKKENKPRKISHSNPALLDSEQELDFNGQLYQRL